MELEIGNCFNMYRQNWIGYCLSTFPSNLSVSLAGNLVK